MVTTLVFCILLLQVVVFSQNCPAGFNHQTENLCFFFSEDELTYDMAKEKCACKGGKLAEPKCATIDNFLMTEAQNLAAVTGWTGYWLGLDDIDQEGTWEYASDDAPVTYTNWYPGEPNDSNGEDCLMLWADRAFSWNDNNCAEAGHYICQIDL